MSTRGPQRWCPHCGGQVYFHHVSDDGDVWYCQGCGKEITAAIALERPRPAPVTQPSNDVKSRRDDGSSHGSPKRRG